MLVLAVLLGAAVAYGASKVQTPLYSAESTLLFRDAGFDQQLFGGSSVIDTTDPAREAATNVSLVELDEVSDLTAESLDLRLSGSDVRERVEVSGEGQADLVSVLATDSDPELAATLANKFARNYIQFRRDADRAQVGEAIRLLEDEIDRQDEEGSDQSELEDLGARLGQLRTLQALQTGNAELVQQATAPGSPSSPQTMRNTFAGGFLGLVAGLAAAFLLTRFDRKLRSPAELESAWNLPVLASVPFDIKLKRTDESAGRPINVASGAFQMLRGRLRYFNVDREIRTIAVTSAVSGEGKSTIASNLAATSAAAGIPAVLVETDLHRPTLAPRYGVSPLPGLSEILTHQSSNEGALQTVPLTSGDADPAGELTVIVSGASAPNPLELIESDRMKALLVSLEEAYDLVVLDLPPATMVADALPLLNAADGVIVVSRIGWTTWENAAALRTQLEGLGRSPLGVVANMVKRGRGESKYGYSYQYGKID